METKAFALLPVGTPVYAITSNWEIVPTKIKQINIVINVEGTEIFYTTEASGYWSVRAEYQKTLFLTAAEAETNLELRKQRMRKHYGL